jgi:hypothetical protein
VTHKGRAWRSCSAYLGLRRGRTPLDGARSPNVDPEGSRLDRLWDSGSNSHRALNVFGGSELLLSLGSGSLQRRAGPPIVVAIAVTLAVLDWTLLAATCVAPHEKVTMCHAG